MFSFLRSRININRVSNRFKSLSNNGPYIHTTAASTATHYQHNSKPFLFSHLFGASIALIGGISIYENVVNSSSRELRDLPRPQKFNNNHRESEQIIHIQTFGGAKLGLQINAFPPEIDPYTGQPINISLKPDKEFHLMPMFQSTPEGTEFLLNCVTHLGHNHALEGLFNTVGVVVGSYKYKSSNQTWSIKPQFQFVPNNESFAVEFDYRGPYYTWGLNWINIMQLLAHYNQSITKNISAGIQLDYALLHYAKLNYTTRIQWNPTQPQPNTPKEYSDILSATYKNDSLICSYYKKYIDQHNDPITQQQHPGYVAGATEFTWNPHTNESRAALGIQYQRGNSFKYCLGFNSEFITSVVLDHSIAGGNGLFTISGELNNKTGEGKYGWGFNLHF